MPPNNTLSLPFLNGLDFLDLLYLKRGEVAQVDGCLGVLSLRFFFLGPFQLSPSLKESFAFPGYME